MAKRKRNSNATAEKQPKKHQPLSRNKSSRRRPPASPPKAENLQEYQYDLLPDHTGTIRLLQLLPGNFEEDLHCDLHTCQLQEAPAYEAISYTWGSERDSSEVRCLGQRIYVPRNLVAALRKLRFKDRSRLLWADSICIDQCNVGERGHQVVQMGTIFQKAKRVIAWVGDNTDDRSVDGLKHIKDVASRLEKTVLCDVAIDISIEFDRFDAAQKNLARQAEQVAYIPSSIWKTLETILNSPWFTRVWILQEIGLAAKALLVFGNFEMEWETFTKLCQSLHVGTGECTHANSLTQSLRLKRANTMSLFNFKAGSNTHAGTILHMARRFNSSNAHDQVYAVLGHAAFNRLSRECGTESWTPVDYSLHHSETYLAVAEKLLMGPVPLSCLHLVQHTSTTIYRSSHSWVPQWNIQAPSLLCGDFEKQKAHGNTTPKFFVEAQKLHIHGFRFDAVEYCSDIIDEKDLVWAARAAMLGEEAVSLSIVEAWERLKLKREGSPGETDIVKDMCNALTAGGVVRYEDGENIRSTGTPPASGTTTEYEYGDNPDINTVGCPTEVLAYFKAIGILHPKVFLRDRNDLSRTKHAIQPSFNRRLFITRNGYFGIGPRVLRPGDLVCFFFGDPIPFALRTRKKEEEFRLVGECYVAGAGLEDPSRMGKRRDFVEEVFILV